MNLSSSGVEEGNGVVAEERDGLCSPGAEELQVAELREVALVGELVRCCGLLWGWG